MELELLDVLLRNFLAINNSSETMVILPDFKSKKYLGFNEKTIQSALEKLLKDEFITHTSGTKSNRPQFMIGLYKITFEGLVFIQQGGYVGQMDRNQRLQNERQDLEALNRNLVLESHKMARINTRLTYWVASGAVVAAIAAVFQILQYFGVSAPCLGCLIY